MITLCRESTSNLESSLSCPSSQVNAAAAAAAAAAAVSSVATAAASDTAAVAAAAAAAVTNSSFVLLASGSISQRLIEVNDSFTSKQFFFVCFFSCSTLRSQKSVSAYFTSKHKLHFGFAPQCCT